VLGAPPDRVNHEQIGRLGAERVVFWVPPAPRDVVLPVLDKLTPLLSA
jgi:hypothetical protein